jgi:hypothetical protein
MRLVENSDISSDSEDKDILEMHHPFKDDGEKVAADGSHHTEEYWKTLSPPQRTKQAWVKEEEGLNRGHRASESFAVLNELVVVCVLPFESKQ